MEQGLSDGILVDDDVLLRQKFFSVIRHHHPDLYNRVNVIFSLAQTWIEHGKDKDFEMLASTIDELEPAERTMVASVFSHNLNLHNLTEDVFNVLRENARRIQVLSPTHQTHARFLLQGMWPLRLTGRAFEELVNLSGIKPEDIYKTLCKQQVDLVFTAHPTQALRREMTNCHRNMRINLSKLHSSSLKEYDKQEVMEELMGLAQTAWRTDEIHRSKPTPQDEMRAGLASFVTVIFPALPKFLRRLDACLATINQPRIPLSHAIFKFGSWMGGDRDGNPNVTHDTTRDVCIIARITACDLYFTEIEQLMFELSLWRADQDLEAKVAAMIDSTDFETVATKRKQRNYADFWTPFTKREPYRVILSDLRDKIYRTREVLHSLLPLPHLSVKDALEAEDCISDVKDLADPLLLMYNSLINTGDEYVANGHLLDLIRQVHAFGMSVVTLDVRQESSRHSEVIDAITTYLGLGSYLEWPEADRLQFLFKELKSKRPILPPGMPMSEDAKEVIDTFRVLANLPNDSLGAYVISMARAGSDILAVMLLQRECGMKKFLRVVPLFETLDDLDSAPASMSQILGNEWYSDVINGKQECMIGYSDSGKDAGRLAAAWALYQVQEALVKQGEEYGVDVTLFHGRGGTVGRGGGPAHVAIKSQPPGTIKGKIRVTVQGEVITQQFGEWAACQRTMDMYTSAVLEATLVESSEPKEEWSELLTDMANDSCKAYREIVFQDPQFVKYFRQLTPVAELAKLNIGSRPAARKKSGGIETLRAIPWIFAWNQTRFLLPVWLGIGNAIKAALEREKEEMLKEMYNSWTFFRVTLDLVEMVLAKADPSVVKMYDKKLVDPELSRFGDHLRELFEETKTLLQRISGHGSQGLAAQSANPLLFQKIKLRSAYVTPLNLLQIKCLEELRKAEKEGSPEDSDLAQIDDALVITIKGIAAGLQNTG